MRDQEHKHYFRIVLNVANDAMVADAVAPKLLLRASQRFAQATRIFRAGDAIAKIGDDAPLNRTIELRELPLGVAIDANFPGQD